MSLQFPCQFPPLNGTPAQSWTGTSWARTQVSVGNLHLEQVPLLVAPLGDQKYAFLNEMEVEFKYLWPEL